MKNHHEPPKSGAAILPFPPQKPRRGRPRSTRPNTDTGTPELVMKKLLGETTETLDLCLEKGLITKDQHWCGIHFRWLYTLRFGAPSVRAIDPTHIGGIDIKTDDPDWRAAREIEYHEAIRTLTAKGHVGLLLNLCIHNERPRFLNRNQTHTAQTAQAATDLLTQLRNGLDTLAALWGRGKKK